jgi:O-antigen/teichoic acid export membrane protein
MEHGKFLKDISASTVQIGVTQVVNLIVFYLISKYISKEDFGFYNWSVALISTLIAILSFGMDLVYLKRVALNYKRKETISLHFFHSLFSGIVLSTIAFIVCFVFPDLLSANHLFLLILINQVCFNVTNSIKLCLNGYEKFNYLALIALIANGIKILLIVLLLVINKFNIEFIIYAFILNYVMEFCVSYYLVHKTTNYIIRPQLNVKEYKAIIVESLPQLGTVLFDSALARLDWILMGVIATSVKTAEYAFSFKIFEVSKMPYLIIAPILLTRFSKLFKDNRAIADKEKNRVDNLFKTEMFIAMLIPIIAVVIWTDFFDLITDNKYGKVNQLTYIILSICIPLHYATNFLWTMAFTQGQLKQIFWITAITSALNIVLNFLFIPLIGAEGAALSFLISTILQVILYNKITRQDRYQFRMEILLLAIFVGIFSVALVYWLNSHFILKAVIVTGIYFILARLSNLMSFKIIKATNI